MDTETPAPSADDAAAAVVLSPLDLSALLCSRLCHDVIGPAGAIVNGLEMLEYEKDAESRADALRLVRKSADTASAKLQFCRLAFGAAGSAGAAIDTGEAEKLARNLFEDGKVAVTWVGPRLLLAKNKVKLLLNLCLIAGAAIPRGGTLDVAIEGGEEATVLRVVARGTYLRVAPGIAGHLHGTHRGAIDAHNIQPHYTALIAAEAGLAIVLDAGADAVTLLARAA